MHVENEKRWWHAQDPQSEVAGETAAEPAFEKRQIAYWSISVLRSAFRFLEMPWDENRQYLKPYRQLGQIK